MPTESLGTLVFLTGLIGVCVGSFINVVVYRLPKMMEREWQAQCAELRNEPLPVSEKLTLSHPRSRCPQCGHQITAIENIPLISYFLILKGKCSSCKAPISLRYPCIEAITGTLSAYTAWHLGPTIYTAGALLLIWSLIALSAIDFDTQLLPDSITQPLLWCGLLFNLNGTFTSLSNALIGAMVGYLVLWSIFWLFKLATGKEGMGYGDFKLLAALGAWLGWTMLPAIVLLSSVVGAVVGLALITTARRGRDIPIPFGPYLAAAGGIALFWGPKLNQSYLGMLT
ncbi:MAG: prepilin peptidase [Rhodocyclales bacterium GT-UBC]|nr:MAG: prepilin peptidase [Rhodocyclales bacterium GT-UBC]